MYEVNVSLNDLEINYPDSICLPIPADLQQQAWEKSRKNSHPQTRHNAYINYLTVASVSTYIYDWLEEATLEYGERNEKSIETKIFKEKSLSSIWEFINGSIIEVKGIRIALIPCDSLEIEEVCIPQEWLDIPDWQVDYYLPIQINLDNSAESWLRVWGYIKSDEIHKENVSQYELEDRAYYIDKKYFNLEPMKMLISLEEKVFNPQKYLSQLETASASNLSESNLSTNISTAKKQELNGLTNKMMQYSLDYPRLHLPFDEWQEIFSNDELREMLYQKRVNPPILLRQWLNQKQSFNLIQSQVVKNITETVNSFRGEIDNITSQVINLTHNQWQNTEEFFNALNIPNQLLTPARGNLETVDILNMMQPHQPQPIRMSAMDLLGVRKNNHPEVIQYLTNLIKNDRNEEIRYHAALTLAKLEPNHPLGGVKNLHLIDLGFQLAKNPLALVMAIIPKSAQKMGIWLEVKPINQEKKLPAGLTLSVLSESGETKIEVTARQDEFNQDKDDLIQKCFTLPTNTYFQVKVCLNQSCFSQEFFA